jgi:hypothetical protein
MYTPLSKPCPLHILQKNNFPIDHIAQAWAYVDGTQTNASWQCVPIDIHSARCFPRNIVSSQHGQRDDGGRSITTISLLGYSLSQTRDGTLFIPISSLSTKPTSTKRYCSPVMHTKHRTHRAYISLCGSKNDQQPGTPQDKNGHVQKSPPLPFYICNSPRKETLRQFVPKHDPTD